MSLCLPSWVKLWIFAQIAQIFFDVVVALGLYLLTKKYFGKKAAFLCVFVFSILFFEARASIVPYKDIFNLYIMLAITLLGSLIFFQKRKKIIWFLCICFLTGLGYYFMPSIVLYPFFLVREKNGRQLYSSSIFPVISSYSTCSFTTRPGTCWELCQDICLLLAIYCLNSVLPHHPFTPQYKSLFLNG